MGPGLQMGLPNMQTPPLGGQPSLGHLWRPAVMENPPIGQDFRQCTWPLTLLRNGQTHDYTFILACGSAGRSGTWKEHDWKTSKKEIWKRGAQTAHFEWEKNVNWFASHQKETSAEESHSKVDRCPCPSLTEPVSLLPEPPAITQGVHERVATVPRTEVTCSHSNTDIYSPQLTRLPSPLPPASHWTTPWMLRCDSLAPIMLVI